MTSLCSPPPDEARRHEQVAYWLGLSQFPTRLVSATHIREMGREGLQKLGYVPGVDGPPADCHDDPRQCDMFVDLGWTVL